MALDPDVEARILDWIGAVKTGDEALATAYARCGTVEATALSILRRRRSTAGPEQWAVAGDYSESNSRGVDWLDRQIAALEDLTGAPGGINVVPLVRCGRTR